MKVLLASILFWGNALLAVEALLGLLTISVVYVTWGRTIAAVYLKHHLGHIAVLYITMVTFVLVITMLGATVFWKLRSKEVKYQRAERASASYTWTASAAGLGLSVLAFAFLRVFTEIREGTTEDIAYAMYRYYLNPSSRGTLDHLHIDFRCCGINGYTDWVQAAKEGVAKNSTRMPVPMSCCTVATPDGTCFQFQDRGCRAALLDYLGMWVPSLVLCTVFAVVWLILLATTSQQLRRSLTDRKSGEDTQN